MSMNPKQDAAELAVIAVEIRGMILKQLPSGPTMHMNAETAEAANHATAATLTVGILHALVMNDHAKKTGRE